MQVSAEAETSQVRPGASPAGSNLSWQLLTPLPSCACPAGVQSREKPVEESAVPARKRTPSDSHYEKSSPEPSSPRSPTVLSPEVVSTIAANPGGRPKEVCWGWVGADWGDMPLRRGMAWSAFTASLELGISDGFCGGGGGSWQGGSETLPFALSALSSGCPRGLCPSRNGTDPFFCSPQPHLHSYKEAFEEMEGAAPTSPPSSGGEISPPTPAFPVSPQTPYSNTCKCHGSGRQRGSVGGSGQARNLPRVRQLQIPDTHRHVNHSSSPSSFLLHVLPLHAAVSLPLISASHAWYPRLGFFAPSTRWSVFLMGSQGGMRREACLHPIPVLHFSYWHGIKRSKTVVAGEWEGGRRD